MSGSEDLTCRELVEMVTDYLEGALTEPERVRLEVHLAGCEGCTRYLEQLRRTISLTGMLTQEQIPPEARDELLRVFREWRSSSG